MSTLVTMVCERYIRSGKSNRAYSLEHANGILSEYDIPSWCFDFTMKGLSQPGRGSMLFTVTKQGFRNVSLLPDHGNPLLVIEGMFLGVIQETSSIACPEVTAYDTYWSESTREKLLEKALPLFLDWIEQSSELSTLAPADLCDLLFELLEFLMGNSGNLETMADAVDELMELSSTNDILLQLTYLAGLLLSLFSQLEGHYYRWQLAYLRQAEHNFAPKSAEQFSLPCLTNSTTNNSGSSTEIPRENIQSSVTTAFEFITPKMRIDSIDTQQCIPRWNPEPFEKSSQQMICSSQSISEDSVPRDPSKGHKDALDNLRVCRLLENGESITLNEKSDGGGLTNILGVVQMPTKAGDHVFIEASGQTTFVLRTQSRMVNDCAVYKVVGKCEFLGLTEEQYGDRALREGKIVKIALA